MPDEAELQWRRRSFIAQVDVAGRLMLLDVDDPGALPIALEGIAADVWLLLGSECTKRELLDELLQGAAGRAERQGLDEILAVMEQLKLVEAIDSCDGRANDAD